MLIHEKKCNLHLVYPHSTHLIDILGPQLVLPQELIGGQVEDIQHIGTGLHGGIADANGSDIEDPEPVARVRVDSEKRIEGKKNDVSSGVQGISIVARKSAYVRARGVKSRSSDDRA